MPVNAHIAVEKPQPKEPKATPVNFFDYRYGEKDPNEDEILLCQLLLAEPHDSVAALHKWAADVRAQRADAEQLKESWTPDAALFDRLREAFSASFSDGSLHTTTLPA